MTNTNSLLLLTCLQYCLHYAPYNCAATSSITNLCKETEFNRKQEITECRRVMKFSNETLKPAIKNSIMANPNILTRKELEKISAT